MHNLNDFRAGNLISLSGGALVIGAGGHLMSSVAIAAAQAGATAICADSNLDKAIEVSDEINSQGLNSLAVKLDISNRESILEVRNHLEAKSIEINYLVNGAGINAPTPFMEIRKDEWHRIFEIQLFGVAESCQIFGEQMLKRGRGSIINISSASAGPPLSKAFVYSCAKSAIVSLTQNLGREWATNGVRVNAIRPGFFPTEWNKIHFIDQDRESAILNHTPMKRFGEPSELATAAIWLLSDKSSFVTATEITIDGGFSGMTI